MLRKLAIFLVAAAVVAPVGTMILLANDEDAPKVLMFVRDGARDLELMLDEEVGVMKSMLEQAGYEVVVATASGEPMRAGGLELRADLKLSEADMAEFDALALPCMAPAPGNPVPPETVGLVKEALMANKPIAAARGSVAIVAKAGGLDGKAYAYAQEVDPEKRPDFDGGRFVGLGVHRDENLSTSGVCPLAAKSLDLPDGTKELTQSFIESIAAQK